MKTKTKLIITVTILIILLIAWAPWITDEYALNKVKNNLNFIKQHATYGGIPDTNINVFRLPFGKTVTTGEGLWYVTFLGVVI